MNATLVRDRLEVVGVSVGAFLVLVGLGTLAGMPWQYNDSIVTSAGQIVGALAAVGIGAGLAALVYLGE